MTDPGRLRRLLGGPDTAWLVRRVRSRLERGTPLTGKVTLGDGVSRTVEDVVADIWRRAGEELGKA